MLLVISLMLVFTSLIIFKIDPAFPPLHSMLDSHCRVIQYRSFQILKRCLRRTKVIGSCERRGGFAQSSES